MREGHIFTDSQIEKGYVNYLKDQVSRIGAFDKLVHHITSPGGDVYEGYDAYHYLRSIGKPIKTIIEGQCQSIATMIAFAGNEVVMLKPSRWMVHEASIPPMGIGGTAEVLERGSQELRKINSEMAERYASKTGKPLEAVVELMKKETPMTAEEAKQYGFVDEVITSLGELKQYDKLKAVALGTDMEEKTGYEKLEKMFENFFSKFSGNAAPAAAPVAVDLAAADGKMINVASENGDLVGKPATVDGQPAPDGEHPLADGRTLVIAAGVVTEVKEAMTPEQKEIADLKSQLQAMQSEKAAAEAARQASEQQVQTVTNAMQEVQKEVQALKKMTVGPQAAASKGKVQAPVATGTGNNWDDEARKELFEETGINNWIKLKSN